MMYGVWNSVDKRFMYGIQAPTKEEAWNEFTDKCPGWRCWRFEVKAIPKDWVNPKNLRYKH